LEIPYVRRLPVPTARLLFKRDPIAYDIDAVVKMCAKKGIVMELNAAVQRLDLNDVLCKRAKETGVMLAIDSDAHNSRDLNYRFGIMQARRAWLEKKDVLNTMSLAAFQKWLKK